MKYTTIIVFSILVSLFFSSCISSKKSNYFHDLTPGSKSLDSSKSFNIHKLKPNDRLSIVVSSTDPALTAYLNPTQSSLNTLGGYLVDLQGSIEFPLLGRVPVAGLTTVEIEALLKEKLTYYYKDLYINVTLVGKIFFLTGKNGGNVVMQNERMTIFEAITQISSIDPFDQKNKVWLIREDSGKQIYAQLDLNSKKIFDSQYYYLKTNDLIYIKPGKFSSNWFNTPSSPFRGIITVLGSILALIFILRTL
jgi:polysaccharide export outer membrane protein